MTVMSSPGSEPAVVPKSEPSKSEPDSEEWEPYEELKNLQELLFLGVRMHAICECWNSRRHKYKNLSWLVPYVVLWLQYQVAGYILGAYSMYNDPLTHVEDSPEFNETDPMHLTMASVQANVRHPGDQEDAEFWFISRVFMFVLATNLTKDWMEFFVLSRTWANGKRGCCNFIGRYLLPSFAFMVASIFMWIAGKILARSPDVSTVLGTVVGLYVTAQIDDAVKDLINASPVTLEKKKGWSYQEAKTSIYKAEPVNAAIFGCSALGGMFIIGLLAFHVWKDE